MVGSANGSGNGSANGGWVSNRRVVYFLNLDGLRRWETVGDGGRRWEFAKMKECMKWIMGECILSVLI